MKVIVGGIIEKNGKYLLVQEAKKVLQKMEFSSRTFRF